MADDRIAYGARCTWWGPVAEVAEGPAFVGRFTGQAQRGLPVCPSCGGVLFEVESRDAWWGQVRRHGRSRGDAQYVRFVAWLGEQSSGVLPLCWRSHAEAREQYDDEVRRRLRAQRYLDQARGRR